MTATCACPDTFVSNMTKSGKIACSCPNGTVSTVKNLRNVCEPATFSTFTAVPDLASELAMSDDEIARALLNKEPVVRPVDKDDGGSSAAVVLLLFILVLIIVGCVFIKCKKTKSGPEVRNFYALQCCVHWRKICRFESGSPRRSTQYLLAKAVLVKSILLSSVRSNFTIF